MPENLSKSQESFLLSLARKSIGHYLSAGRKLKLQYLQVPKKLLNEGACFVTLHVNKRLRGCIGSLEARRPLAVDVAENALAAAFGDPRFPPLSQNELPKVKISISILTKPKPLEVRDAGDLLKKLVAGKHGLVVRKGSFGATFLPAVWEELPGKEEFLSHLCMKAGLAPDEWKKAKEMRFAVYGAREFSE